MKIEATILPQKIEIYLSEYKKGTVIVDCAFQVGKLHPGFNQTTKISVALTKELFQAIEDSILPQIADKITKEEEP